MLRSLLTPSYRYLTLIDKPVTSLSVNTLVQLSAQSLRYCYLQYGVTPQISIFIGAMSMNMRRKQTWLTGWIYKIFLVDLQRDCIFYELDKRRYMQLAEYYKPERLFASAIKGYTMMNMFRGAYFLISDPTFAQFIQSSSSLFPLSSHDPLFLLPIPIILLNYLLLAHSPHPFLIHLTRPQNKPTCLALAFMSGLLFVPLPGIFGLTYGGMVFGHLMMRYIRKRGMEWREWGYRKWMRVRGLGKKKDEQK